MERAPEDRHKCAGTPRRATNPRTGRRPAQGTAGTNPRTGQELHCVFNFVFDGNVYGALWYFLAVCGYVQWSVGKAHLSRVGVVGYSSYFGVSSFHRVVTRREVLLVTFPASLSPSFVGLAPCGAPFWRVTSLGSFAQRSCQLLPVLRRFGPFLVVWCKRTLASNPTQSWLCAYILVDRRRTR